MSAEDRVGKSLDDLIKDSRKKGKGKGKKPAAGGGGGKMDVDDGRKKKAEASIGKGKANRQAQISQKRGLQQSGKATDKQVKKQTLKVSKGGAANAAKNARGGQSGVPKMVISFNPNQLSRTTDAQVQQQIKGVLAKAPKTVSGASRPFSGDRPKPKSRTIRGV